MADLNAIRINDFPQTSTVLSSDKIILFDASTYSPIVCNVGDLSAFALLSGSVEFDGLKEKVNAIVDMAKRAKMYLDKTFITKTEAASTYATKTEFSNQLDKLETTSDFNGLLAGKASNEDLEAKYQAIKSTINKAKYLLGAEAWDNDGPGRGYKRIVASKAAVKEESGGEE